MNRDLPPRYPHFASLFCRTCMLALLGSCLLTTGCQPTVDSTAAPPVTAIGATPQIGPASRAGDDASAKDVLDAMAKAYQSAKTYADAGQLVRRSERNGQVTQEPIDFSIAFERPNKIRIHCYEVVAVCDGKQLHATIGDLDGQVLALPAPQELHAEQFLDIAADPELAQALNDGPPPIQLQLLLDEHGFEKLMRDSKGLTLLTPAEIEGQTYKRVSAVMADNGNPIGNLVFWVDPSTHVLRRLEIPIPSNAAAPDTKVSLIADFRGAQLNQPIEPVAFRFETPRDAHVVRRFVSLQRPAPPPALLGQKIGDFSFASASGAPLARKSLNHKATVLEFWSAKSAPCRDALLLLQQVRDHFKDSPDVDIRTVNVDPAEVTDAELAQLFKEAAISLPILRNKGDDAEKTFAVKVAPTLFLLGEDGTIEDCEEGLNSALVAQLPGMIDKLVAGHHAIDDVRAAYESQARDYEQAIKLAQQDNASTLQEVPTAKIAPHSDPKSLTLTKLWQAKDIKSPGNILVVEQPNGPPKLLVHEYWQTVVELDATGQVVARHKLDLPEKTPVSYLRTAVDAQGKRYYAAFASPGQQVFLFDADWKLLMSFPELGDGKHDGIADVQFVDLSGSGKPELAIGYWGETLGVQRVSLEGQRLWRDRAVQNVWRLAATGPDAQGHRRLLCANARGVLATFDHEGTAGPDITVLGRPVLGIVTADMGDSNKPLWCALSEIAGSPMVMGIDPDGQQLWSYLLPRGVPTKPIEPLTTGNVLGTPERQWVVGAADGSIHILSAAGKLVDEFNYGAMPTGLAAAKLGDDHVLLVATPDGLEAWKVQAK